MRDGAATTYGSDSTAGVMDYITRSDFVGLEASANHKMIEGSDGDTEFRLIWRSEYLFGGDTQVVSLFSHIERTCLPLAEREWVIRPFEESPLGGWSSVRRPAIFVPYDRVDATPGGFGGLLSAGTIDPQCEALGGAATNFGVAGNTTGGFCRFQYTPFFNLVEPATR